MKTSIIIGIVVVIVLAVIVGMFFIPSSSTTVLAPTPNADEEEATGANDLNQFLQEQPSSTPPSSPTPSVTAVTEEVAIGATVEITDTGFVPATMKVKPGTTVTFINHGQGQHWVASDPHPSHTLLSDFDGKKALTTGDSYTFRFTKSGTWTYHDHLNPSMKGSVVVE